MPITEHVDASGSISTMPIRDLNAASLREGILIQG
jgi:hypothetical protein